MSYSYSDQSKTKINALSRYRDSRIIADSESKIKFLETYERKEIPRSPEDFFHDVKPEEELRLDLISYRYYQTPLLWWVIASANDIHNPMVAPLVGDTLRIPSITSLYGNQGLLL